MVSGSCFLYLFSIEDRVLLCGQYLLVTGNSLWDATGGYGSWKLHKHSANSHGEVKVQG